MGKFDLVCDRFRFLGGVANSSVEGDVKIDGTKGGEIFTMVTCTDA